MFSCEFWEISKNTFFTEYLRWLLLILHGAFVKIVNSSKLILHIWYMSNFFLLSTWQQKNMYIFFSFFSLKYISGKCPLYSNVFDFCGKFWVIFTWDVSKPLLLFTRTNNSQFWREWNSIDKLQSNRFFWKKMAIVDQKLLCCDKINHLNFFSVFVFTVIYTLPEAATGGVL